MTKEDVLKALSHVDDPDLKKDIVSLNMVQDVDIQGNVVKFKVVLTTPACPMKEHIRNACITAVQHFLGKHLTVEPEMTANVTTQRKDNQEILPGVKNIILVGSGKGGVGKSTVAANLAIALSLSGAKVGLLDADIYGPSVPILFHLQGHVPYVEEIDGQRKMLPIEQHGIEVMSIGFLIPAEQALAWRGPMTSNALRQLISDTVWGELDYLVIDLPPGTGDIHITVSQSLPVNGALIVTTPQDIAVADSLKAVSMFKSPQINVPILGIVENMSFFSPTELPDKKYYIFGKGGGELLAKHANSEVVGEIPIVEELRYFSDEGKPLALDQDSMIGKAFRKLAETVAQKIAIQALT